MSPEVIKVLPLPNYQLDLTFENGERGVFDCSRFVDRGVFKELRDTRYFRMVKVWKEAGTICWPNGQDLCPDTLYLDSRKENIK